MTTQTQENQRQAIYADLHACYVRITQRQIPFTIRQIWAWEEWSQRGHFTLEDLETVLTYIQAKIKTRERRPESLRFETITRDWGKFEDDLAEAKAMRGLLAKRKAEQRAPREKIAVLEATGRMEEIPDKTVTPAQVLNIPVAELVAQMRRAIQ